MPEQCTTARAAKPAAGLTATAVLAPGDQTPQALADQAAKQAAAAAEAVIQANGSETEVKKAFFAAYMACIRGRAQAKEASA